MIKPDESEPLPWEPPALIYGGVPSVPLKSAAGNAFVLVPGTSNSDSVMADDHLAGLAGVGAAALAVIFLALLAATVFLRKGL